MANEQFEAFRSLVLRSRALQEQLLAEEDAHRFIALVVDLGTTHGCVFTEQDVRQAMAEDRRAWLERWVV